MNKSIKLICILFCFLFLITSVFQGFVFAETESNIDKLSIDYESNLETNESDYLTYYQNNLKTVRPENTIVLNADSCSTGVENAFKIIDNKNAVVIDNINSYIQWDFEIQETGMYSIYPCYYPLQNTGKDILLKVEIDGKLPYTECSNFSLNRLWKDEVQEDGTLFVKDSSGDEIKPLQIETLKWYERPFYDETGVYSEPYLFYFERGKHTLRITTLGESIGLSTVKIQNKPELISYKEYHSKFTRNDLADVNELIYLQAEKSCEKTSQDLYPVYDRSSAATMPNNPTAISINTIGKSNWSEYGERISWEVNVPKAGLYKIAFRARQNYNSGMNAYRNLYINGEIPFKEAENIVFSYDQKWQIVNLGGDNSYYVWLEPGDILSMECTTGNMSSVIRNLQQSVLELNELYRKIIVVTGISPDIYRDYYLEDQIPELVDTLKYLKSRLDNIITVMDRLNGGNSTLSPTVKMMSTMLQEFYEDTYFIPERLSNFKSNIESLGSLITSLGSQALELDYICFIPSGVDEPKANAGFLKSFSYTFLQFVSSFTDDYNMKQNEKSLEVWVSTGRDQAQILKSMIEDSFVKKYKINVNVSLVDTGDNLIKATLAGKGPDVALMISEITPVNLAMRGMLVDLDDYLTEEDLNCFRKSALKPFYFQEKLYALPETQTYDVLFYRKDILTELGISVPKTWNEFYSAIKILQSNNLSVGVPEVNSANAGVSSGISTFCKFLFQSGGTYYNENLTGTLFDTPLAQDAFTKWVELYSLYGLDRGYEFFNCFRSGDMPLAIANITSYNQLAIAAPEIKGLWDFTNIPGTVNSDGIIDCSEDSGVTGSIIISGAKKRGVVKEAVEFIKWWTGEESQSRFGKEIEATLGISARYYPANLNAIKNLNWSEEELQKLENQGMWLKNVEQIPGNYMVNRSLTNAFRAAVRGTNTPARSLSIYNKDISAEIQRKREEFNLD